MIPQVIMPQTCSTVPSIVCHTIKVVTSTKLNRYQVYLTALLYTWPTHTGLLYQTIPLLHATSG